MDYRRRYLRRLANQSQGNPKEELLNENKTEEKVEEKPGNQNIYLQKLLVKNTNTQSSSTINLSSVNDNLPSFASNIRDILSTEENKQRAIKYVIHKRNEEKYGTTSPFNVEKNEQEESNPALASKYYKNSRNININNTNEKKQTEINNNQTNSDSKYSYPHYYARRFRNYENLPQDNQENKNENNNKTEIINNAFSRKRFQVSSSATNIVNSNDTNNNNGKEGGNNITTSVYLRRNKRNNINSNDNNVTENKEINKEQFDNSQSRYKYYRGYAKRNENEQQNDKNRTQIKEEIKPKENANQTTSIPLNNLNLNLGYKFSFKNENYNLALSKKGSSNESIDKNKLEYNPSTTKNYTYVRSRNRKEDIGEKNVPYSKVLQKDYRKEKVIELKILTENNMNNNSRYRRKYGRFANNNENNTSDNLSFKDEKDIINYINKKYEQDKIIEIFRIKKDEKE